MASSRARLSTREPIGATSPCYFSGRAIFASSIACLMRSGSSLAYPVGCAAKIEFVAVVSTAFFVFRIDLGGAREGKERSQGVTAMRVHNGEVSVCTIVPKAQDGRVVDDAEKYETTREEELPPWANRKASCHQRLS